MALIRGIIAGIQWWFDELKQEVRHWEDHYAKEREVLAAKRHALEADTQEMPRCDDG